MWQASGGGRRRPDGRWCSDERRRAGIAGVAREAIEARPPGAATRQLEQPVDEEAGVARRRPRRPRVALLAELDVLRARRPAESAFAEQGGVDGRRAAQRDARP